MRTETNSSLARRDIFRVEIIRRDNHSWQGQIFWANEGKRQCFRSALELLRLMSSAIEPKDEYRSFSGENPFEDAEEACVPEKVREDMESMAHGYARSPCGRTK